MLEFLGLGEEAVKVCICFFLIGILFGPPIGIATANNDSKAAKVLFVIATIISVISLFICAGPVFMLFITFQWKYILLPLFGGAAVCALLGFIFYGIVIAGRKAKYRKNPIIKEAAKYFKNNDIAGVQCNRDCVKFYSYLPNSQYCTTEYVSRQADSLDDCNHWRNNDFRPAYWKEYDFSPAICHCIMFADHGYPNLENLDIFAKAFTSLVGGVKIATHKSYYTYTEYIDKKYTDNGIAKRIHNTYYTQDDRFIYRRAALAKVKKKEKAEKNAAPKPPKTNTWE